jgi:hypothetical protein
VTTQGATVVYPAGVAMFSAVISRFPSQVC